MARRLYTVQNLVDEVRSLLDEDSVDTISTENDILPALNRAQDYSMEILAKQYEDPFLEKANLPVTGGIEEYDLPLGVYSGRLEKVEFELPPKRFYEVKRLSYRDISAYETTADVSVPSHYSIIGNKIRFVPTPSGTYNARLWYLNAPETLVLPQGKITRVDEANNRITVDAVGTDLTTEVDNQNSYTNIVDGHTGIIKGTLQLQTISGTSLTFKSTPTRTTVENRTISSDLATLLDTDGTTLLVQPDDYICVLKGACVLYFARPMGNYIIKHAVTDLKRKLGADVTHEIQELDKFESQVQGTWAGRENTLRVKKRSKNWGLPFRRWYHNNR